MKKNPGDDGLEMVTTNWGSGTQSGVDQGVADGLFVMTCVCIGLHPGVREQAIKLHGIKQHHFSNL